MTKYELIDYINNIESGYFNNYGYFYKRNLPHTLVFNKKRILKLLNYDITLILIEYSKDGYYIFYYNNGDVINKNVTLKELSEYKYIVFDDNSQENINKFEIMKLMDNV